MGPSISNGFLPGRDGGHAKHVRHGMPISPPPALPPGRPTLPVMAHRVAAHRLYCSPMALRAGPWQSIRAAGLVVAYSGPGVRWSAASTPDDVSGPGRCFFYAILPAENIFFKFFKPDGEFIQKSLIVKVFFDHHIGHGREHRCVRAGSNWNPFIGHSGGGVMVPGIHSNDFGTVFFGLDNVIHGVGAGNHAGRIPAPQDNEFGIEQVFPAVSDHDGSILG